MRARAGWFRRLAHLGAHEACSLGSPPASCRAVHRSAHRNRLEGDLMAEEPQVLVRGFNWREAFPFTHIFRAFRVAIHPSKLALALLALLSLYIGGRLLDTLWFSEHLAVPGEIQRYA